MEALLLLVGVQWPLQLGWAWAAVASPARPRGPFLCLGEETPSCLASSSVCPSWGTLRHPNLGGTTEGQGGPVPRHPASLGRARPPDTGREQNGAQVRPTWSARWQLDSSPVPEGWPSSLATPLPASP